MRHLHSWERWACMLIAPVAGAMTSAIVFYVIAWIALRNSQRSGATYLQYAFLISFSRELVVGYLFALPALFVGRWFGLRSRLVYMLIAGLAVSPVALFLSTPRASAMFATEEELSQGTQWDSALLYMTLATTTGLLFASGASKQKAHPNGI